MNYKHLIAAFVAITLAGYWYLHRDSGGNASSSLVAVEIPTLTSEARRGKQYFDEYCSSCHGLNAAGKDGTGPPLIHRIYEPSHHGDRSFYAAAANGVRSHHWRFGNMPPVAGVTEEEIKSIVSYVRELQRANGIH